MGWGGGGCRDRRLGGEEGAGGEHGWGEKDFVAEEGGEECVE